MTAPQGSFFTVHIPLVENALMVRQQKRAETAQMRIAAQFATARRSDGQRWRKLKKDLGL